MQMQNQLRWLLFRASKTCISLQLAKLDRFSKEDFVQVQTSILLNAYNQRKLLTSHHMITNRIGTYHILYRISSLQFSPVKQQYGEIGFETPPKMGRIFSLVFLLFIYFYYKLKILKNFPSISSSKTFDFIETT